MGKRHFGNGWLGISSALVAGACTAAVENTDYTIEVTHQLPIDFTLYGSIARLEMVVDEIDGGASLFSGKRAAWSGTTVDNFAYTGVIDDVDFDGKYEEKFEFNANPIRGDLSWVFAISGSREIGNFGLRGRVYRTTSIGMEVIAEGAVSTYDGGGIYFGDGLKRVTITYDCSSGVQCRSGSSDGGMADAGILDGGALDAGSVDAGAVADAGAGSDAGAVADAGAATDAGPPPPAPGVPSLTQGEREVELSWTGSADASIYNVYRRTFSTSRVVVGQTTATTYRDGPDSGIFPGLTYYYEVTAANAGGESASSGEAIATTFDLASWTIRYDSASLESITYGSSGGFVAVGRYGRISTSGDGVIFTNRLPKGRDDDLENVRFVNGTYYAVGDRGIFMTSSNGVDWTIRDAGVNDLNAVTVNGSTVVVAGRYGTILVSDGGETWTSRDAGSSIWFKAAAYGNGRYVLVGASGTILTSTDTNAWTQIDSGTTSEFNDVGWHNNSYFIAAGNAGTVSTSPDGIAWTTQILSPDAGLWGSGYGGGGYPGQTAGYIVVGTGGALFISWDALNWSLRSTGTTKTLYQVAYGSYRFAAVGDLGVVVGTNDIDAGWGPMVSGATTYNNFGGVAFGPTTGAVQAVVTGLYGVFAKSADGIAWSTQTIPYSTFLPSDLVYGTTDAGIDLFVAVGYSTDIALTSPDGLNWTQRDAGSGGYGYSGAAIIDRTIYAVSYGRIASSPTGEDWTIRDLGLTSQLYGITSGVIDGGTIIVAVGENGLVLRYPDAGGWDVVLSSAIETSLSGISLFDVDWNGKLFVAVGYDDTNITRGTILTSPDGRNWTPRDAGGAIGLYRLTHGGLNWVIVDGEFNDILTSTDGVTWSSRAFNKADRGLYGIAYRNGRWVLAGRSEWILTSP